MLPAIVVLILAWALGDVTHAMDLGGYLALLLGSNLPLTTLPALIFIVAAATAFATGTSWGTMAILFPIVIPLAVSMGVGVGFAGGDHYPILLGCISSVMAGAVFGDHCSPISDTTVLSALSSACDIVDHVTTQLPYAFLVAGVALLVGEIPVALGWLTPGWSIALGLLLLYGILRRFGRDPES